MTIIGIECSGTEFMFVVAEGTQQVPTLIDSGKKIAPANADRPDALKLRKETQALLTRQTLHSGVQPRSRLADTAML